MEAHTKLVKSREKVEGVKNSAVRKRKAEEKEQEVCVVIETENEYLLFSVCVSLMN